MKIARLYGFGKRGQIWFKHLVDDGYQVDIVEPKLGLLPKNPQLDLAVIASSNWAHKKNIDDLHLSYDVEIIVEKPILDSVSDLMRTPSSIHPAYCERFKYATQFFKNLNLKPESIQLVFPTTWLDTGVHLLDLVRYLGYNEFLSIMPKYVNSYGITPYDVNYTYTTSPEHKKLLLLVYVDNTCYQLDLLNNSVRIYRNTDKPHNCYYSENYSSFEFGKQYTIPTLLKDYHSLHEWSYGYSPTLQAIKLTENEI